MTDREKIDKIIEENMCFEYCSYCIYQDDCPQYIVCYGGEPIEPYCVGRDIEKFIDIKSVLEDIKNGDL